MLIWFNENVRFQQKDTLKRFFERFEQNGLTINYFRADCGSCSEEIIVCYFNGDVSRMAPKIGTAVCGTACTVA